LLPEVEKTQVGQSGFALNLNYKVLQRSSVGISLNGGGETDKYSP